MRKSKCLNQQNECTIAHDAVHVFLNYTLVLAAGLQSLQRCHLIALIFHIPSVCLKAGGESDSVCVCVRQRDRSSEREVGVVHMHIYNSYLCPEYQCSY